jgi:protein gp37
MAETTITWTSGPRGELGYTFNGWIGCTQISPGCDHCYAAAQDKFRSWTPEGWGTGKPRRRTSEANWRAPLRWNTAAAAAGERRKVFCSSLADVFDNEVPAEWRVDLFGLIRQTPNLDWLLLTKRIGNAHEMMVDTIEHALDIGADPAFDIVPWPNVWLGATVVNQEEADRDITKLLATPARVRFLSIEPLLGPVDLTPHLWGRPKPCWDCPKDADCQCGYLRRGFFTSDPRLHWVIAGGESGPHARPMHPDWVRSLRDQCAAAGVPFHFKQWGEWWEVDSDARDEETGDHLQVDVGSSDAAELWDAKTDCLLTPDGRRFTPESLPEDTPARLMTRLGKKAAGRLLDGVEHNGYPETSA